MKLEGNVTNNLHQKAARKSLREVKVIGPSQIVFSYIEDFKEEYLYDNTHSSTTIHTVNDDGGGFLY
jgi:hypothetical protein